MLDQVYQPSFNVREWEKLFMLKHSLSTLLAMILFSFAQLGCGNLATPARNPHEKADTRALRFAINEAKLINANISDPRAENTYDAPAYRISTQSRLLMRFSSLRPNATQILSEQPLLLRIELTEGSDIAVAKAGLKTCPITSDWMLAATWKRAHTYRDGNWRANGGDFDATMCAQALAPDSTALKSEDEALFCSGERVLCFDVSNWMQTYVRERGQDLGLILINEREGFADLHGDNSARGPTLFWRILRD